MVSDKLFRGFQLMQTTELNNDQLKLLFLIHEHQGKRGPIFSHFFQDAFDDGPENSSKWVIINQMDDVGFIELDRDTPKGRINHFIIHPNAIDHIKGKYRDFYEDWAGPFHTILRTEIPLSGQSNYFGEFVLPEDLNIPRDKKCYIHVNSRINRAIIEIMTQRGGEGD